MRSPQLPEEYEKAMRSLKKRAERTRRVLGDGSGDPIPLFVVPEGASVHERVQAALAAARQARQKAAQTQASAEQVLAEARVAAAGGAVEIVQPEPHKPVPPLDPAASPEINTADLERPANPSPPLGCQIVNPAIERIREYFVAKQKVLDQEWLLSSKAFLAERLAHFEAAFAPDADFTTWRDSAPTSGHMSRISLFGYAPLQAQSYANLIKSLSESDFNQLKELQASLQELISSCRESFGEAAAPALSPS